ncbi:hypothetical protein [Brumimicrobium mesophilum]|uniref:hypothetical protein n=1 Tax=Brumimicrobium mesophilum TaxID=392717 RepID=UPI000D1441DD|nr:hypothetical protein [Brumimicrobium mesophilum]
METIDKTPGKFDGKDSNLGMKANKVEVQKKPFWKKHFLKLFLVLLIIASLVWGFINNRSTVNTYEKQITEINTTHEEELQSIKAEHLKQLVSTLALAVRSEMIAENMNQVNQYFVQSLNNVKVERLILVNQSSGKAILSTNKKDEGTIFGMKELVGAKSPMTKVYDGKTYAATPIMGLNMQLGVLIMQVD